MVASMHGEGVKTLADARDHDDVMVDNIYDASTDNGESFGTGGAISPH